MSDAEQQPTTVSGAADTIKGLLNQSADNQQAPTETETVAEETSMQVSDEPVESIEETVNPSDIPNKDALSEESTEVSDEETSTQEISEEPIFPVTIDGQKYEVNQQELINGYQRQADYSRKTEELSIERKQQEDQLSRERETVQSQMGNLMQLEQSLRSQLDAEMQSIDFDKMYEEDPVQASRLQYQMQKRQKDLEAAQQKIMSTQQQEYSKYVAEQEKQMFLKMPEMKDPAKASVVKNNMKEYLADQGYQAQEIAGLTDHRMLLVLKDAMAYRKLVKSKPALSKKVADAPRVVKPGMAKTKNEKLQIAKNERVKRLKKSGSLRDAAAIFRESIKI